MSNIHFPVYILMVLLIFAVTIPLQRKPYGRRFQLLMVSILGIAWIMALLELLKVLWDAPYSYTFGSYPAGIGIEFLVDEFSALMTLIVLTLSLLIIIYSLKDLEHEIESSRMYSYYTLVFLLIFSMIGMIFTNDMFNLYVFMEILSITSVAIIAIKKKKDTLMASMKYLMMGAIGSVTVLMGIALIYMVTGQLNMSAINQEISAVWRLYPRNILLAMGFMITGFSIKAAIFPLHNWLPDAHSTAPTPSSALLSGLVVKAYVFSIAKIMYRVVGKNISVDIGIADYLIIFAVLSMMMGSVFALTQRDIKRRLAYSSVSQIGYIFLGLALASEMGFSAALFHVVSHAFMKSALFLSAGSIIYLTGKRDVKNLDGIGYEMPITMTVFSIGVLGMIGIPGTSGFMSKWYLGLAVLDAGHPELLIVLLLSSFLNALYYLPIIVSAFLRERPGKPLEMHRDGIPETMKVSMVLVALGSLVIGLFPHLVMDIIQQAVPTFIGSGMGL
ncbi:monovalent cation/H+ antiporter subunit D family protein [Proteiniclasticum sp. SCR006]|uniref:Monovalent cation/H+ antiporter subunit D family protein n=1 Tax=Proteiniclasticum aestuarii TaxID=2817862 RepID=A0A939KHU6_9CLOT|nr:monovalent cation/H+ antiporter subunit D family protein [Proteiniclasticum aestuarii]MBO1263473.1 monovalent cation/H+ antiporter subunit D family protein [Proteiniclasticum aestuarii]